MARKPSRKAATGRPSKSGKSKKEKKAGKPKAPGTRKAPGTPKASSTPRKIQEVRILPAALEPWRAEAEAHEILLPAVQYQVSQPLGHFERFVFSNQSPWSEAIEIGYRLYARDPGGAYVLVYDKSGLNGAAPPLQTFVDPVESELHVRKFEAKARLLSMPNWLLTCDYASQAPDFFYAREILIGFTEEPQGHIVPFGHMYMRDGGGNEFVEPIPPYAFALIPAP